MFDMENVAMIMNANRVFHRGISLCCVSTVLRRLRTDVVLISAPFPSHVPRPLLHLQRGPRAAASPLPLPREGGEGDGGGDGLPLRLPHVLQEDAHVPRGHRGGAGPLWERGHPPRPGRGRPSEGRQGGEEGGVRVNHPLRRTGEAADCAGHVGSIVLLITFVTYRILPFHVIHATKS